MELKLEGVSKKYPNGVQALSDVSLTIPRGMFGLLGPNGAGKSTLMRCVSTLQDFDSGSISFDGIDVKSDKEKLREVLGYLPQDFGVYPKVTAWDMLDHLAQLKGLAVRGASVSRVHGNFLVTDSGATASDVIELMDQVIKRVHDAFGVTLAREVVVWKRTVR